VLLKFSFVLLVFGIFVTVDCYRVFLIDLSILWFGWFFVISKRFHIFVGYLS